MSKATLTFHQLEQISQETSSSDPNQSHMLGRVFFVLTIGAEQYPMSALIRQPYGTDMMSVEGIEAEVDYESYSGRFNLNACRDAAEDYYRTAVGAQGMIGIGPGANVMMHNNDFSFQKSYAIEIQDDG